MRLIFLSFFLTSFFFVQPCPAEVSPQQLLKEGESFLKERKIDDSIQKFKEVIELGSKESGVGKENKDTVIAGANKGLARAYYMKGDLENSIYAYQEAVKLNPKDAESHYELAILCFMVLLHKDAEIEAAEALKLSPENKDYRLFLARVYDRNQKYDKAIKEIEFLIKINPEEKAKYLLPLSSVYEKKGERKKAEELLKEVLNADSEGNFGKVAKAVLDNFRKSEEALKRIPGYETQLKADPKNADLYYKIAKIYFENKDNIKAKENLELAVALDPKNPEYRYLLGIINEASGKNDDALISFEKAVELDTKNVSYHIALGSIYYKKGSHDKARKELEEVIRLAPDKKEGVFARIRLKVLEKEMEIIRDSTIHTFTGSEPKSK